MQQDCARSAPGLQHDHQHVKPFLQQALARHVARGACAHMLGQALPLHQRERCPKAPRTLSGADPRTSSCSTYTSLHPRLHRHGRPAQILLLHQDDRVTYCAQRADQLWLVRMSPVSRNHAQQLRALAATASCASEHSLPMWGLSSSNRRPHFA